MRLFLSVGLAMIIVSWMSTCVHAAGWGNLKLQFVYDGKAPKPSPLIVRGANNFCANKPLFDESLVVNSKNNGVANVVVYVRDANVPVHPRLERKTKAAKVTLEAVACRFAPRVVCAAVGQELVFRNRDPVGHNIKINAFSNPPICPLIPAGGKYGHKFAVGERIPTEVDCTIHPWMRAWIIVRSNPYVAVSDKDGVLELKDLPAGNWEFQIWHEKIGYVDNVTVGGEKVEWSKGRPKLTISAGKTLDLSVVKFK